MKKKVVILGLVLFNAVIAWYLWDRVGAELAEPDTGSVSWLEEKWGKKLYSQHDEELIIRDFFDDRRGGFFVDVGASHYRVNSTTFYLEERLGWSGIAIDAIPDYEAGYLEHRPNTEYYSLFVGDRSDDDVEFFVIDRNWRLSTGSKNLADRQGDHHSLSVPTITLDDLLDQRGVEAIDFLSMDIERAEPQALAGFDIERFLPELVCIEAHPEVRGEILDYFERHRYRLLERYLPHDPLNYYFAPVARARDADGDPPAEKAAG